MPSPPARNPSKKGMRWWSTLSPSEKRNEVRSLIETYGLSNTGIKEYLGLETPNMVAGVRNKINQLKKEPAPMLTTRLGERLVPPRLTVHVNETPREKPDEETEEVELAALIEGRWNPVGTERPFLQLPRVRQRRVERQVIEFLDWRASYA